MPKHCRCGNFASHDGFCKNCRVKTFGSDAPLVRNEFKPKYEQGFGQENRHSDKFEAVGDKFATQQEGLETVTENPILAEKLHSKIPRTRISREPVMIKTKSGKSWPLTSKPNVGRILYDQ